MESALTISASAASARRSARLDLPLAVGPAISQMRGSMDLVLTLLAPPATWSARLEPLAKVRVHDHRKLSEGPVFADDYLIEADDWRGLKAQLSTALNDAPIDWCLQPVEHRRKRLLVADMDSTI